jgi:hypothetical protein
MTGREIVLAKAREHGVPIDDIMSGRRYKVATRARQEAVIEIRRQRPHLTTPQITRLVGVRSHSSVLYALRMPYIRLVRTQFQCGFAILWKKPVDREDPFLEALVRESSSP